MACMEYLNLTERVDRLQKGADNSQKTNPLGTGVLYRFVDYMLNLREMIKDSQPEFYKEFNL